MLHKKRIFAIIPARGGSKGLPKKNILEASGKPLIAWTISEAQKSKYIDRLILSSDDSEIIEIAKKWGCEVPFVRPKRLATDEATTIAAVFHAMKSLSQEYDYVVLLQPTSPLRKVADIDQCIEFCNTQNAPACVSVTEADKNPYWMFQIHEDKHMTPAIDSSGLKLRRQNLPIFYTLNGAVYVAKWDWLLKEKTFLTKDTIAYIMEKESSLDIDTKLDFDFFKFLTKSNSS